jgi:hypothetical protein
MIVAIVFAHVWGVLELIALSALTRTTRVRTILAALVAGLYTCSLVALLLQLTWTRAAATLTGEPLDGIVMLASYTLDPFIEELVKLMPLAVLIWVIPNVRRQWSISDCVLVGAATGSGFGLAENLFRYSGAVHQSISVYGGWLVTIGLSSSTVPSLTSSLKSWLPSGAVVQDSLSISPVPHNLHLAWSALGGLAVALIFLQGEKVLRRAGAALLLYVATDHAALNWTALGQPGAISVLAAPFNALRSLLWMMPIAALAVAWWLDRSRQRGAGTPELALTSERRSSLPVLGRLRSAVVRPPWSIFWVDRLTRLRRTYAMAGNNDEGRLREAILDLRDRIDGVSARSERIAVSPMKRIGVALLGLVRQPKVIIWLALMLPSAAWLVLGGFPQTAWLQSVLMTRPAWIVVRALSFPALMWIALQVVSGVRRWAQAAAAPLGDVAAEGTLRLLSGAGAFLFGAYTLTLAMTGRAPQSQVLTSFHVLAAIGGALVAGSLLTALSAVVMFPPIAASLGELVKTTGMQMDGLVRASLAGPLTPSLDTQDVPSAYTRPDLASPGMGASGLALRFPQNQTAGVGDPLAAAAITAQAALAAERSNFAGLRSDLANQPTIRAMTPEEEAAYSKIPLGLTADQQLLYQQLEQYVSEQPDAYETRVGMFNDGLSFADDVAKAAAGLAPEPAVPDLMGQIEHNANIPVAEQMLDALRKQTTQDVNDDSSRT